MKRLHKKNKLRARRMSARKPHIAITDFDDIKNPLLAGGQARATFEVAKRLVTQGHQVTVICSRYPNSCDETNEGISYRHIGLGSRSIRLNNFVYFFALPFAVSKLKADVIIECFTAPISTCFTPLFTSTPVIGMPTMFEAKEFSKKYHLPFHWIETIGCKVYRYFLAYSPLNKSKMERLNPNIITRIIPNGVDESMFTEATSRGDYALFIGRIDMTQKGLDIMLEAINRYRAELPIKFIIAGNGSRENESKLLETIKSLRLESIVSFVGRVDGEKKKQLLTNARFGVYPSRFEDFPLVPLEFTAHGKPLVCFDIPGMAWITLDVAMKAKTFDTSELGEAFVKLANDTPLLARMESHCRLFAQRYGWDNIAKDYARFCYEVLELEDRRLNKKADAKNVLVLGGAGYIGSVVCNYLHDQGDNVTIFDTLLYEEGLRSFAPHRFIKGDIRDITALEPYITEADVVINLAALSNDPASDLDPRLAWEINYLANEAIANTCKRLQKRAIFISSCSVYGFSENVTFTEENDTEPVTLYGMTKKLSEKYYSDPEMDSVILRLATVYGMSDKPRFDLVVNTMVGNSHFKHEITVNGGNQWRPLVHIKDVARAIYHSSHATGFKHKIYNVGSDDQNYQISDLAKFIKRYFPTVAVLDNHESVDGRSYRVDFSRITNDLGFKAIYAVNDAIREFDDAFRTNKITSMADDVYYRVKYLKNYGVLDTIEKTTTNQLTPNLLYNYEH